VGTLKNNAVPYRKYFTGKAHTVERNAQELGAFCRWLGKTPEDLRNEYVKARRSVPSLDDWRRNTKNILVKYYNHLKELGKTINTARTCASAVMAFYSQNCEGIPRITKELDPVQVPSDELVFTQETLRRMYFYANPTQKAWLTTAVSMGYGASDFLSLECEMIKNLVQEAKEEHKDFISFIGKGRRKTSVQPISFLTPESIDALTEYLKILERDNDGKLPKYLWNNASDDTLNDWLKALIRGAGIETYGKKIRFHAFRKFLYSRLVHKDRNVARRICAKAISPSEASYDTEIVKESERVFRENYKDIALNGDLTGKAKREQAERIEQLENALAQLERENMTSKTRIDNLHVTTISLESKLKEYGELLAHWVDSYEFTEEEKEAIRRKWNIRKISEQEKQYLRDLTTIMEEIRKGEGHLDEEDMNKLKRRLKAVLEKKEKWEESQ